MARRAAVARRPSRRALEELSAQLNALCAKGEPIAFAFPFTPMAKDAPSSMTDQEILSRQLSIIAGDDPVDTKTRGSTLVTFDFVEVHREALASVLALVTSGFSEPQFEWSRVEREIGLVSPSPVLRAKVVDAVRRCVALHAGGPVKRHTALRKSWSEVAYCRPP